jgi:hypothetical protein
MNRLTNDDALFGYRLQLFDLIARTSVSEALPADPESGRSQCPSGLRPTQPDSWRVQLLRAIRDWISLRFSTALSVSSSRSPSTRRETVTSCS